jgi:hypothetical protein
VSFQDIQGSHGLVTERAGYKKIEDCCAQALAAGFPYVWIDTCCIDKTNSTELSEAINSMFRWYQEAGTCYTYLADVSSVKEFAASRWFKRGWTLQELIAPTHLLFFDSQWTEIGSRASLGEVITKVTGIPFTVLMNSPLEEHCIAEIMSWAAGRQTTRIEDRAYSLLGLFRISMPLIYGEGGKAFTRLQMEIMKTTTDHSLFAWYGPGIYDWGALAHSPDNFKNCGRIRSFPIGNVSPYEMTNLGLRITIPCQVLDGIEGRDWPGSDKRKCDLFGVLNCKELNPDGTFDDRPIGIWLKAAQYSDHKSRGQYVRSLCNLRPAWPTTALDKKSEPILLHIIQLDLHRYQSPVSADFVDRRWPWPFVFDYGDLVKNGYYLQVQGHWDNEDDTISDEFSSDTSSQVLSSDEPSNKENSGNLLGPTPWMFFFQHNKRMDRFWVAFGMSKARVYSMIEPQIGISDTPESILENIPPELEIRRSDPWGVFDRIFSTLPNGDLVKLTIKRGVVSNQEDQMDFVYREESGLGYLAKISISRGA